MRKNVFSKLLGSISRQFQFNKVRGTGTTVAMRAVAFAGEIPQGFVPPPPTDELQRFM